MHVVRGDERVGQDRFPSGQLPAGTINGVPFWFGFSRIFLPGEHEVWVTCIG